MRDDDADRRPPRHNRDRPGRRGLKKRPWDDHAVGPIDYGNHCRGKVGHSSKAHALSARRRFIEAGTVRNPDTLQAYKCRSCGHWHLGNSRRRQEEPDGD